MSQKQIKRLRKEAREIMDKEFPTIFEKVREELTPNLNALKEWQFLFILARKRLPDIHITEFLPSNFNNIYRALMLAAVDKTYSPKLFQQEEEFIKRILAFACSFSFLKQQPLDEDGYFLTLKGFKAFKKLNLSAQNSDSTV